MPLLEDQEEDTQADGSHDNLNDMSSEERAESDRLLEDASKPDDEKDSLYKKKSGKASGVASAASAIFPATKLGKIANFFSRNKRETAIGGTILGAMISLAIFVASILAPSQLIWMNSIFGDFNFGPHNRSVVQRTERIRIMFDRLQFNDSRMGAQAETINSEPSRSQRVRSTSSELVSRSNKRVNYRNTVTTRINNVRARYNITPYNWSIFRGEPSTSSRFRSPRNVIRGTDSTRVRVSDVGSDRYQETAADTRNSDDPTRHARSSARSFARGSLIGASMAVACVSSMIADVVPNLEERYEILLSRQGHFLTAGSQLAAGDKVHGDEVVDLTEAFQEEVETLDTEERDVDTNLPPALNEDGEPIDEVDENALEESDPDLLLQNAGTTTYSRGFEESAAWKRATNLAVDGSELDTGMSFIADHSFMAGAVLGLGNIINSLPATSTICSTLANPYVGWTLTIVEGVASLFSGPGAVVRFAAVEGIVGTLSFMIMNMAFSALVPESPAELTGQIDMGMNLSQSEHGRSQGAPPVTHAEMASLRNNHFTQLAVEDREKGFVWRYLSPDNPRSTLTSMAMGTDIGFRNTIRFLVDIPSYIGSSIKNLAFKPVNAEVEFTNYDINQFAFSEETINKIDPVDNDTQMTLTQGYRCFSDGEGGFVDGAGQTCDEGLWSDAILMDLIIDRCMNEPYYRQMGYNNADRESEYVGEWTWERTDGPNDEISHRIDCSGESLGSGQRQFWEKVGVWRLDQDIMDNIECLSHNDPC